MSCPKGWSTFVLSVCLVGATGVSLQGAGGGDVDATLERIEVSVKRFYSRALNVLADVRVRVQPLRRDLSSRGRARNLLYEMRVEWTETSPEPVTLRKLLEVDGRPPKPGDDPGCADPELLSEDPLAIFLPGKQQEYVFSWFGRDREAGRETVVLDYRLRHDEEPTIEWDDECVSIHLPGKTEGRVWSDAESGDVLRVDEYLAGMFEFRVPPEHSRGGMPMTMTIERADSSVRYRPVVFADPDETLLLPSSIELMTVWRNAGVTRQFITQEISNYRRFLTGARIVGTPRRP